MHGQVIFGGLEESRELCSQMSIPVYIGGLNKKNGPVTQDRFSYMQEEVLLSVSVRSAHHLWLLLSRFPNLQQNIHAPQYFETR